MKIHLTGATGKVGRQVFSDLTELLEGVHITGSCSGRDGPDRSTGLNVVDICDPEAVTELIESHRPDIVINFAAIADVFLCEEDPATAMRVNVFGAANVAAACKRSGSRMIQISSDYVFDGNSGPSFESDVPRPINVYGRTKLEAESACRTILGDALTIVRLAHVFNTSEHDPATGMLDLGTSDPVPAPNDIVTTPTAVTVIAPSLVKIIEDDIRGVVHISGNKRMSWFDIAAALVEERGASIGPVVPVSAAQWQSRRMSVEWPRDGGLASVYYEDIERWLLSERDERLADTYERMWGMAREKLTAGLPDIELPPGEGDMRWGSSIIFRLGSVAESVLQEAKSMQASAGGGHSVYDADSLHTTVMSVGTYREKASADDEDIRILREVISGVASRSVAFRNEYRGVAGTGSGVLAQGWPGDGGLERLRNLLRIEMEKIGLINYPDRARPRITAHASLLLFESPIAQPEKLVQHIEAHRDNGFGAILVEHIELVSFVRTKGKILMKSHARFSLRK